MICCGESLQEFISEPRSPNWPRSTRIRSRRRAARRRVPSDPLARGGTDSALRLVTCWSSDALCLSSSGRTGRKSENRLRSRLSCGRCASLHAQDIRWIEQPTLRSRPSMISSCTASARSPNILRRYRHAVGLLKRLVAVFDHISDSQK